MIIFVDQIIVTRALIEFLASLPTAISIRARATTELAIGWIARGRRMHVVVVVHVGDWVGHAHGALGLIDRQEWVIAAKAEIARATTVAAQTVERSLSFDLTHLKAAHMVYFFV